MKIQEFRNIAKIGVISDTHIPTRAPKIPEKVFEIFKDAHLIIHCGDLVVPKVVNDLESITKVVAVKGNMDRFSDNFPRKLLLSIDGNLRIGVIHGDIPGKVSQLQGIRTNPEFPSHA
jgi:hypothetical protein